MTPEQYSIIATRRQAYDTLLWQMPAVGIAAQSFLIATALAEETPAALAIVLAAASCLVAGATVQFFQKLRYMEMCDSEILAQFEIANAKIGFSVLHGRRADTCFTPPRGLARFRAYRVWLLLLLTFFGLTAAGLAVAIVRAV